MHQVSTLHYVISAVGWLTLLAIIYYMFRVNILATALGTIAAVSLSLLLLKFLWVLALFMELLTNYLLKAFAYIFFPGTSLHDLLKEDSEESRNYLRYFPSLLFSIPFSIAIIYVNQRINRDFRAHSSNSIKKSVRSCFRRTPLSKEY